MLQLGLYRACRLSATPMHGSAAFAASLLTLACCSMLISPTNPNCIQAINSTCAVAFSHATPDWYLKYVPMPRGAGSWRGSPRC